MEQQFSTVSTIHRGKEESHMDKACFLAMTIAIILVLIIVLIVVLKDRDFDFSIKKDKKNDALHINAKHHDNLDK